MQMYEFVVKDVCIFVNSDKTYKNYIHLYTFKHSHSISKFGSELYFLSISGCAPAERFEKVKCSSEFH